MSSCAQVRGYWQHCSAIFTGEGYASKQSVTGLAMAGISLLNPTPRHET